MTEPMWRIVAGRAGWAARSFAEENYVGVGWNEAGDPTGVSSAAAMLELFGRRCPALSERQASVGANQLWRFIHGIKVGDDVISYDRDERRYLLRRIKSAAKYFPDKADELPTRRGVEWRASVDRDALSDAARGSLGAILTLMLVPPHIATEIRALALGQIPPQQAPSPLAEISPSIGDDVPDAFAGIEEQSVERIKDRIVRMNWEQMQDLVAALLRAMGYRTSVTARGPDRGRDILATPDGFGFRPPRIIVEVKHRPGQTMGAPEVRAMPVGRQLDDRGLFVSTGGFARSVL